MNRAKKGIKKKSITQVKYAVSPQGLHIQLNGYEEFVIPKDELMLINGKVFDNEIKEKEDEINSNTPKQGKG